MRIILIRHGESTANAAGPDVFTGQTDCPLTEKGRAEAMALRSDPLLAGSPLVFSSDLFRAYDTARIIFPKAEIHRSPLLRERSLGVFEGKSPRELLPLYPAFFSDPSRSCFRHSFTAKAPGGESYSDVLRRVRMFLEELQRECPGTAVIVSHFCTIRCFIKELLRLSEEETLKTRVPNCHPVLLEL